MLSIGRIAAGSGYRYLTDQVATQDAPRAGENLHSYYQRCGYPPGVWVGVQAAAFGLAGTVAVEPMARLFGACAHPVTGESLGRQPNQYRTLAERVAARLDTLDHPPTPAEYAAVAAEEAARPEPRPVAGFDLTFSAPKSVSVMWALGGPDVRDKLAACHRAAWRDAFAMFETEVAATRLGTDGIAQVDIAGVTAAAFEHWYSRAGDPQLHTHIAVSTMVPTGDGRWRRLDSRALYRAAAALSERYRAALITSAAEELGIRWEHHASRRSETLLPEIGGVPDELLRLFSTRQLQIETALTRLADNYTQTHGRTPDRAALARLAQQATLDDRPAPTQRTFLSQQDRWADQAAEVLGCGPEEVADLLAERCVGRAYTPTPLRDDQMEHHARATIGRLIETSATWSGWDIRRHASAHLGENGHRADPNAVTRLTEAVLAQPDTFPVGPPEPADTPTALRRADGSSRFVRRGEDRYSSQLIAKAENDLVALAATRHLPRTEQARRTRSLYGNLDDDVLITQHAAARAHLHKLTARRDRLHHHLACREGTEIGIRAGTSNGTDRQAQSLAILEAEIGEQHAAAAALKHELHVRNNADSRAELADHVEGLGVDQAAAVIRLADRSRPLDALVGPAGTGKTTTLRALVAHWNHHGNSVTVLAPTAIGARTSGETLQVEHNTLHGALARWQRGDQLPDRGDLLLIDEASMASTPTLLAAARTATDRGAVVRLVGDPRQLKAVGAGGGLALVAETTNAPELTELHRFDHRWEAQATLGLRRGDGAVLDAYFAHDRIRAEVDHAAVASALRAWAASPAGIAETIMVASDNHTVRHLNTLARTHRVDTGHVQSDGVALADDTVAGVGDIVITRKNQRLRDIHTNGGGFAVRNRDRWHVDTVTPDGSLTVSRVDRPATRIVLPAEYVANYVQLGYAETGHGVQGRTVERAEILVRPGDTRWYLYVAMSRARQSSVAHVITDRLDHEPLYRPGRHARAILEQVLANDEPVSLTERQHAAQVAQSSPARLYDRYRHAQTEELRARLAATLKDLGAGHLLERPDAWQLIHAAHAVEQSGLDAPAIISANPTETMSIEELCQQLHNARYGPHNTDGPTRPPGWHARLVPKPAPHIDADVTTYLNTLGNQLQQWRHRYASRLAVGERPPRWTHALGTPPTEADQLKVWATNVAQVALWRSSRRIDGTQLLGPKPPPGHPDAPAWNAAARAAAEAQAPSHDRADPSPTHPMPASRQHPASTRASPRAPRR